MSIGISTANFIFTMISALTIYIFLNLTFDIKLNTQRIVCFVIAFSITNTYISYLLSLVNVDSNFYRILKTLLLFALSIIIIKYILKISFKYAILSFCIMGIGLGVGNAVCVLFFSLFNFSNTVNQAQSNTCIYIVYNILIYSTMLLFVLLSLLAFKRHKINTSTIYSMVSLSFLIICAYIGVYFFQKNFNLSSFVIMLIISTVFCLFTYWYILKVNENENQKTEIKQQKFYNKSLGMALQDLRRYKHDQFNHLTVVNSMLKMGKYDDASLYMDEIIATTLSLTNTAIFNIKNAGLFGIISSKMDNADKLGVNFDLQVIGVIDSIENIKISELCEIIGIYLDNSIEAAQLCNDKNIEMTVTNTNSEIDITLINNCISKPNIGQIKQDGYSTKGENRGHGLSIVENILNKYNNILNVTRFDNNKMQFIQTLKIKKGI